MRAWDEGRGSQLAPGRRALEVGGDAGEEGVCRTWVLNSASRDSRSARTVSERGAEGG